MNVPEILRNEADGFIVLREGKVSFLFTYSDIRRAAKLAASVEKNRAKVKLQTAPAQLAGERS